MSNLKNALLFLIAVALNSCAAIGGIFKAEVWVGIIIVVVVILGLVMIFRKKSD